MAVDQATADKISNWYQATNPGQAATEHLNSWWNASPSSSSTAPAAPTTMSNTSAMTATPKAGGMLGATTAAPAAPKAPTADVGSWYRNALGRDAAKTGLDYWNGRLAQEGADVNAVFADFQKAAKDNGETVKSVTLDQANSYTGPQSTNTTTPVDDWGRNVLGRNLTPDELSTWQSKFAEGAKSGGAGAQQVYNEFMQSYGSQVKNPMDWATASQINSGMPKPQQNAIPTGPNYLDLSQMARRTVDPATETVRGQLTDLLRADSPYMQQARYDAMKSASERGMLNSVMAASAGEDAAIRSALNIATPDAATYGKASDYNVALENQTRQYNADTANAFARQQQDYSNQFALQQGGFLNQKELQTMQNNQQLSIQQLQDATTRWQAQLSDATSRYNTDAQYKRQAESDKKTLANNIIQNMDISPDRKAAMLEALGEGTSAKMVNGVMVPGTGLAGAAYVMNEVGQELREGEPAGWADTAADIIAKQQNT